MWSILHGLRSLQWERRVPPSWRRPCWLQLYSASSNNTTNDHSAGDLNAVANNYTPHHDAIYHNNPTTSDDTTNHNTSP